MAREMNNYTTNVQQVAGQTATGKPVALLVGDDGSLTISGGGGGGGDATAANQVTQITEAQASNALLGTIVGQPGSDFITGDSTPVAGNYCALVAITDIALGDITLSAGSSGSAELQGITLFAGQTILVNFTSITVDSGVAQLVKNPS